MKVQDYTNLADVVRADRLDDPERLAIVYEGRRYSYGDLDRRSDRVAAMLADEGVRQGDRVAILGMNSAAYVDILFGVAKIGAIFVPINYRLSSREIDGIIDDCEPSIILLEDSLAPMFSSVARERSRVVGYSDHEETRYENDTDKQTSNPPEVTARRDDIAMLIYTSGTTGRPKGAMITHGNFLRYCGLDEPDVPRWLGIGRDEVILNALPLFHVGGLEMLLRPLFTGAAVIVHRDFDVERVLRDINEQGVTMTGLVPTALQMMLDHPAAGKVDFSTLDRFLYGAAPIPAPLLKRAIARMGCDFVQAYGMTENNGVGIMLSPEDHRDPDAERLRSAGKPIFDTELRIVAPDNTPLAPRERGEIVLRSSAVMKGYWNNPEATREAIDTDRWLHTGDAGYLDEDGFVYVSDRIKDMIVSGGENIYPIEVESVLFEHPAVREVAVIGIPHDQWGEAVHAVVSLQPEAEVLEAELIAFARDRLAHYKCPRSVQTVDELPKNATGKILRRMVRSDSEATD